MHVGGLWETRDQIAVASLHAYSIIINSSSAALYNNYAMIIIYRPLATQPYYISVFRIMKTFVCLVK